MKKVEINKKVLSKNDEIAEELRERFRKLNLLVLNIVSSPGSGKTSLLEKTVKNSGLKIALIAGDVQTENDSNRLRDAGATQAFPIVTNGACHLDASMIQKALDQVDLEAIDLLIIENVGNLVCPSSYDLGEDMKVVLISVTEGDDKPLKYPGMFRRSSMMVVNKLDLVEHCDFDIEIVKKNAASINGELEIIEMSCRDGSGLDSWYDWLKKKISLKKTS